MIQSNYYEDNPDLQFTMQSFVNWQEIVRLRERDWEDAGKYKETGDSKYEFAPTSAEEAFEAYAVAFQATGEISGRELAPVAKKMEAEGLKLEQGKVHFPADVARLIGLIAQQGMLGYSVDRSHGGLHMPLSAQMAILEMLSRADAAFGITVGCFNLAEVIERFGDEEMKHKYVPKMVSGEIIGAMALTEPNYGSDLSNILTKAEKDADGTWRISGTKRFITHGCGLGEIPSAILTLARTGGNGARGLSFFLVDGSEIEVARIEHKLGLHISPTCEIIYDKSKATLIGEEGRGLVKFAMEMMNGARLGIAVQALGIAQAAYEEAAKYGRERVQFGGPIDQIPAVARQLREMDAYVQAMRALTYRTSEIVDLFDGFTNELRRSGMDDKAVRKSPQVQKWDRLASLFTPLAKYFCSEIANKVAYEALQIFGGSGYTEEYDAAKIYRDARITTIYEGTSNLQVVAAIGGLVEGYRDGGVSYEYTKEEIAKITDADRKKFVTEQSQIFLKDMAQFREKDKAYRDAYAFEAINSFSAVMSLILLAQQADQTSSAADTEFAKRKLQAYKDYAIMAARQIASSGISLRGI